MKKLFPTLVLIILCTLPLNALEEPPLDGRLWKSSLPEPCKGSFVAGYVSGMLGVFRGLRGFRMPDSLYAEYSKTQDKYWTINWAMDTLFSELGLWDVSFGQLTNGLDEFYKDYRNEQILFFEAIQIVKLGLQGEQSEIIEEYKRWERYRASSKGKSGKEYSKKLSEHLRIIDSLKTK